MQACGTREKVVSQAGGSEKQKLKGLRPRFRANAFGVVCHESIRKKSFETATRHLFRHLDEAGQLKNNPLVRRFFATDPAASSAREDDQGALEHIHSVVREAAEHFKDVDMRAGNEARALRLQVIVTRNVLQRQPIPQVARFLKVSSGYCYRERSSICERIAQYINPVIAVQQPATTDQWGSPFL